ncbi:hypothetical protein NEPAR04_0796 [Nematocida parisii]|nr:hypothetical protein NEPAR03_2273 [Nematocida parisii]KAI5131014.1 hypothetical protein NEPAR08_2308 [Nematocida parisii]KAI5141226.1 hypothetical protein NEPAR04_0796 [Nematocida parisii]
MKGVIDKKYRNIAIYSIIVLGLGITILLFFITVREQGHEDDSSEESQYNIESNEMESMPEPPMLDDSINRNPIHTPGIEEKQIEHDTSDCESMYYSAESWSDKNNSVGMGGRVANILISIASYIYLAFKAPWNSNENSYLEGAAENRNKPLS